MRALVTGATGFLGGRLARLLCLQGHAVRTTGRPGDPTAVLDGLGCEHCRADLLDVEALRALVDGVDTIFHAAAMVALQPQHYERQWQVNVDGTRLLLAAAREAGVQRFVYTSTVNTLGIPPLGRTGDESTEFNWGRYRLGYMDSKRAAEELVRAAAGELHTAIVLPGTMFGPGDIFFSAGTYVMQGARGRLLLALPGGTTVVHVDDVAQGHLLALRRGRSGRRYVLGGDHLSYATLFRLINAELGRRGPVGVMPTSLLRRAGRWADRLRRLGLPIPFNEGLAVAGSAQLYYDSDRARDELGYSPRPAVEAIRDAVAWYRDRGLL